MLSAVRDRTSEEWREVFDAYPNVWAEPFRRGAPLLDHPQMQHDRNAVTIADPDLGAVRQPAGLARPVRTPARLDRPAPRLDADRADVLSWTPPAVAPPGPAPVHPLDGVTVLELGLYYAAPYAGSLLADLGARVIKVEPIEGDPLRSLASFPEIGAIKVLQGKELIALDLASDEGRAVVHELAAWADIVIQSFRAGVAERLGVDAQTLHAINPDLVYINAPGYGVDGPCGHRPAYAPTIAAASGIAWRLAGATMPTDPLALDVEASKPAAVRLVSASNAAFAQCDGLSALAVATVCLLGLVARERGAGGQQILTSMLSTAAHANAEEVVSFAARPATPMPDPDLFGLGPRYRLYATASGWVFLAVPGEDEWARLLEDPDFAQVGGPHAAALQAVFGRRSAAEWEARLAAAGIGCVAVTESDVESVLMSDDFGRASGLVADVEHPMLGEHPRLAALQSFSRSQTCPGGGRVVGAHTAAVLAELGYDEHLIAELRDRKVIALA
jgi:crotonobetainyl-CoA:carnitine CoA-transferase CaiB-like acyl-CoA transferase